MYMSAVYKCVLSLYKVVIRQIGIWPVSIYDLRLAAKEITLAAFFFFVQNFRYPFLLGLPIRLKDFLYVAKLFGLTCDSSVNCKKEKRRIVSYKINFNACLIKRRLVLLNRWNSIEKYSCKCIDYKFFFFTTYD